MLVPCSSCTEEICEDQAVFEEYVEVFVPELTACVVPIIHRERERWRESSLLALALRAALVLLRFFCAVPRSALSQLFGDVLFILACLSSLFCLRISVSGPGRRGWSE